MKKIYRKISVKKSTAFPPSVKIGCGVFSQYWAASVAFSWSCKRSAIRAINEVADICSFEKLMWGSDYPRTMVEITYKMSFDYILKSKEISEESKQKFLFDNSKSFYDFEEIEPVKNML